MRLIKKNVKIDDIPFEEGGLEMLETLIDKVKEEGYEEGVEEGIQKGVANVARNAYKEGQSIEFISKITGLPIEKLKQILN